MLWVLAPVFAAGCGGAGGDCASVEARGEGVHVAVASVDGCGGATWRADVTFADGHRQTLAGERDGRVGRVLLGHFAGDPEPDLVITVESERVYAFVRQGAIFFGRELPPPGQGPVALAEGRLSAGSLVWDPAQGAWRAP